jgi:hypothetical protein
VRMANALAISPDNGLCTPLHVLYPSLLLRCDFLFVFPKCCHCGRQANLSGSLDLALLITEKISQKSESAAAPGATFKLVTSMIPNLANISLPFFPPRVAGSGLTYLHHPEACHHLFACSNLSIKVLLVDALDLRAASTWGSRGQGLFCFAQ